MMLPLLLVATAAGCASRHVLPPKLTKLEDERRARTLFKQEHACAEVESSRWEVDCVMRLTVRGCGQTARYHLLHSGWTRSTESGVHDGPCRAVVGDSVATFDRSAGSFWVTPQRGPYDFRVQVRGVRCPRKTREAREKMLAGQRITLVLGEDPEAAVGGAIGPVVVPVLLEDGTDVGERWLAEGLCSHLTR